MSRVVVVLLLTLASCATTPIAPNVLVQGCALKAKDRPPVQPLLHGAANCTALYAFCLDAADTRALLIWRAEVEAWQDATWAKCQQFPADAP